MISIQEFSTGIQYEKTETGWISRGFTGYFINKTIDPVPDAIIRAIEDRQFSLAEGTVKEKVALIGREVEKDSSQWSVLAVITKGEDEFGRYFPVYRFFYTKDKGNIEHLLTWWKDSSEPIFNPFDKPEVKFYEAGHHREVSLDDFREILENKKLPVILDSQKKYSPLEINALAKKTSGLDNIAWAWNVGGVEFPDSFHVIYPDDLKSQKIILRAISQSQTISKGVVTGENSVKIAIQGLSSEGEVDINHLETLEMALEQSKYTNQDWISCFNAKGTNQAIDKKLYGADMVCLLTLRAIILPETIAEWLHWLKKSPKQIENKETSLYFQQQMFTTMTKAAPIMLQKVEDGVKFCMAHLLYEPDLVEMTVWLLGSFGSLWNHSYHSEVTKQIAEDLSLMSELAKGRIALNQSTGDSQGFCMLPHWQSIWDEIKEYWRDSALKTLPRYLPIAEMFQQLGNYKVAAVFYQIALGSVNEKLYNRIFDETKNSTTTYRGFRIKKQKSGLPSLPNLGSKLVPVVLVIPMLLASFILGGLAEFAAKIGIQIPPNPSSIKTQKKEIGKQMIPLPPIPILAPKKP